MQAVVRSGYEDIASSAAVLEEHEKAINKELEKRGVFSKDVLSFVNSEGEQRQKIKDKAIQLEIDYKKYVNLSYSRKGQDVRYALNDNKLRDLGWTPKMDFNNELEDIVEHYKAKFIW